MAVAGEILIISVNLIQCAMTVYELEFWVKPYLKKLFSTVGVI
jgi:hypothetical protein